MPRARPRIGIPAMVLREGGDPPRVAQNRAYADAVAHAGGLPVLIPPLGPPATRGLYELCSGLLLPGGADVAPAAYGEEARPDCGVQTDPERDRHELALVRWALEDDLALLGICRGMQLLNVLFGGTLWQDLHVQLGSDGSHRAASRTELAHRVVVEEGTRLADVVGAGPVAVNSRHHQGVRDLGQGLRASARSEDGVVEGLELTGRRFTLGVQCHPEELVPGHSWSERLLAVFVDAARRPCGAPA